MLDTNWIENTMAWRKERECDPVPFITGPLLDNAYFLYGKVGELFDAAHKHILALAGTSYKRNPQSTKGAIADEIGDVFMMLATVAGQADIMHCKQIHHFKFDNPLLCIRDLSFYVGLVCTQIENNYRFDLNYVYSLALDIAKMFDIDPGEALAGALRKIEAR